MSSINRNPPALAERRFNDRQKYMIEEFQCPGCIVDDDTDCIDFEENGKAFWCNRHCPGIYVGLPSARGRIFLGMPNGFCRVGVGEYKKENGPCIRLWLKETSPDWNDLNVPVWAMEKDGFLFVRTYMPRINNAYIDVIEEGKLALCPNAIDVSKFYNEID